MAKVHEEFRMLKVHEEAYQHIMELSEEIGLPECVIVDMLVLQEILERARRSSET